jgi:hypothetical protein
VAKSFRRNPSRSGGSCLDGFFKLNPEFAVALYRLKVPVEIHIIIKL